MAQRIMAINDSRDILQMLNDVLTYEGYEFAGALSPELAAADFDRFKPDLVILDWLFGREDRGMEVLQHMRLHRTTATTPVIVCSAATNMVQEVEESLRAKGVDVVYKPFELQELMGAVRGMLGNVERRTETATRKT